MHHADMSLLQGPRRRVKYTMNIPGKLSGSNTRPVGSAVSSIPCLSSFIGSSSDSLSE